ncbi:MAG: hypothetical protein RLZZ135_1374 [Cyanobacteriota bacterium]
MKLYKILIDRQTYQKSIDYLDRLKSGNIAGQYLQEQLKDKNVLQISISEFIELLVQTKRPCIFAERAIYGNGIDWNQSELSILGDTNIATPVTVYDNGRHLQPEVHIAPFAATLIFTSGALLRNGQNLVPADWEEVVSNGALDSEAYYRLYERRLLPGFIYIDRVAQANNNKALITIPGLGCGQFSGIFKGKLGEKLKNALIRLIETHGNSFSHIKAIYYDPYSECENQRMKINGIDFLVRPLNSGNIRKPQLCKPESYAEIDNEFDNCELFSFVAWDHVSWPGNDFYGGARMTDDGVKAAATNLMAVMTDIEGRYDQRINQYCPPAEYSDWDEVVSKNKIQLEVKHNLVILP